jgi:DNA primase
MQLLVDNYNITTSIYKIIEQLQLEANGSYLDYIKDEGDYVTVTCPFHKDGHERKPSASVYARYDNPDIAPGTFHCFTCDKVASLPQLISYCLRISNEEAKQWIIDRFGGDNQQADDMEQLEEIPSTPPIDHCMDDNILSNFEPWHPYMAQRKLSREICEQFEVKYDPKTNCIVFPVRDETGKLVFLTRRSVVEKKFIIDTDVDKPVYLFNVIKANELDTVVVCESQINALTLWTWGIPAVALFGCDITKHQLDLLNNSTITHYVLALDGDKAGWSGMCKFIYHIRKDVFVDVKIVPKGKDVNDLTKEEYENSPVIESSEFIRQIEEKEKNKKKNEQHQ